MGNFLLLDFLTLMVDTCKIYIENGRLMAFLAALIISFQTMLYLINIISIKTFTSDLIKQIFLLLTTRPTIEFTNVLTGMQRDIGIFAGVLGIFFLLSAMASVFFTVSTTHASALIHGGKKTSIKDLASRTIRSLRRSFVTAFYINLLALGFIFVCLIALLPFVLIFGTNNVSSSDSGILFYMSALVFYTYLSVVWNLSVVVSIIEKKSGIQALGKATETMKGMKLLGFTLSIVLAILSMILLHVMPWMFCNKPSEAIIIVMGLLVLNSMRMVEMFGHTAYTVFYYKCKESHGEEVELEGEMEYTKIASASPLLNENIP